MSILRWFASADNGWYPARAFYIVMGVMMVAFVVWYIGYEIGA